MQQVAGATGAAVMVAPMSRVAAGVAAGVTAQGGAPIDGIAQGTSLAFLISAGLSVVTVVISLFVRRNPAEADA